MKTELKVRDFEGLKSDLEKLDTDLLLFVIDYQVWSFHFSEMNLEDIPGKKVIFWKAPNGERVKNLSEFESCVEFFLEKGVHRNAHLVAIGGGATSDFGGFVASSLLRGISWSVVPTTLLSMVDASIGGKVAINSRNAKNLIGAFHLPTSVTFNQQYLKTLPDDEWSSGLGEVIKYALLDKNINEAITEKNIEMADLVHLCANYKLDLSERDFKELHERKYLNLGHTFGHAIEKVYDLPHGLAVFWGMTLIFKVLGQDHFLKDLKEISAKLNYNYKTSPWLNRVFQTEKIIELVQKDKKVVSGKTLEIVTIDEIGKPKILPISLDDLAEKLRSKSDELRKFTL